ncbi:MAG: hypothetical protein ACREMZ_05465 [Gemmatimonadales bacterium]
MPLEVSSAARIDPSLTIDRGAPPAEPTSSLLERLAGELECRAVPYCQWKGHWTAHRWKSGRGDIDLLVGQDARADFRETVEELGFKPAVPAGERQMPGVESYFGLDPAVPRLLHLHVHYRLVLGQYWTTTYRLPIERPVLDAAVRGGDIFMVPAPTHRFLIFVLRVALLQRGRHLLSHHNRGNRGIQIQLNDLESLSHRESLAELLRIHLPSIDLPFFDRCVAWLRGESGMVEHGVLPYLLHHRLAAHARRPPLAALVNAAAEQIAPSGLLRRIGNQGMRLAGGGTVVALVGGDGAGKSTCARHLEVWLARDFATLRAHLGNPPRSLLTFAVGVGVKAERALYRLLRRKPRTTSHLELFRYLCTARDRHRLYQRLQRFAAKGGIAICERYPVSEISSHVGPCIPALLPAGQAGLAGLLAQAERRYYERMVRPDLLLVLWLDPELAVLRKPGEPPDYVRDRGRAVLEADWTIGPAQIVDASGPLAQVLEDLKARVWSAL